MTLEPGRREDGPASGPENVDNGKEILFRNRPSPYKEEDAGSGPEPRRDGTLMKTGLKHVGAGVLIALLLGGAATGQEVVDRDPFSAPSIEEVIRAADQDRVARITGELVEAKMSEIEQRIIVEVERRLSALLDRRLTEFNEQMTASTETRLAEMAGIVSGLRDEVPNQIEIAIAERVRAGSSEAASMGLLPEGSTFVACVDGRSLYRDENGSTFYMENETGDTGVSRCSN